MPLAQLTPGSQDTSLMTNAISEQNRYFSGKWEDNVLLKLPAQFYYEEGEDVKVVQLPMMGRCNRSFEGSTGTVSLQGFSANLLGTLRYQKAKHNTTDVNVFDDMAKRSIEAFIKSAQYNGTHKGHLIYEADGEEQSIEAYLTVSVRKDENGQLSNIVITLQPEGTKAEVSEETEEFVKNFTF